MRADAHGEGAVVSQFIGDMAFLLELALAAPGRVIATRGVGDLNERRPAAGVRYRA